MAKYIDTLSDELDKSLEEAADEYADSIEGQEAFSYGADHYCWGDVYNSFIAGAEWQKEQMLKESVGRVNTYKESGGIFMAEAQVGYPDHNGDKVRIIVVKEG